MNPVAASTDESEKMSTAFVGRREELAQLSRWFDEGVSLITIGGIGGTGKTRLAREFGLHYAAKSKMQVWFMDCAGARLWMTS